MTADRTLDEWLEQVATEGQALSSYLTSNSYYLPSFGMGGLKEYPDLPEPVQESRRKLREAAKAVHDLACGPSDYLKSLSRSYHDLSSLRWLVYFRIPEAIPLVGSISYAQVAEACDVDESHLRRILRHAMTNRLFYEPSSDDVAHTPISAALVTDAATKAWVDVDCHEMYPISSGLVNAYEKWGPAEEPNQNAFSLANKTDLPFLNYMTQPEKAERMARFTKLVSSVSDTPPYDLKHTIENYDWKSKASTGPIVDIGGGQGQLATALHRAHSSLPLIIVEDRNDVVAGCQDSLSPDIKDKILFRQHNFFVPQPGLARDAKLFILRHVLHDYDDKRASIILLGLIPSLKKGAILVIVDGILPSPGSGYVADEKLQRNLDMTMMMVFGGRERQREDWEALLRSVDPALVIRSVIRPVGSALGILEVGYDG